MYSNFEYYTPTKVIFGRGAELQAGEQLKKAGAKKVLIHYGGKSALKSGLIDRVKASLDEAGIGHVELGGVVPNPHLGKVYEGIELGRKEGSVLPTNIISQSLYTWILLFKVHTHGIYMYMHISKNFPIYIYFCTQS